MGMLLFCDSQLSILRSTIGNTETIQQIDGRIDCWLLSEEVLHQTTRTPREYRGCRRQRTMGLSPNRAV